MPSILNSDDGVVSGTSGLKSTGGNDGLLNIQTNGSNAISISAGQRSTFPTTIGVGGATPSTSGSGISFPATQSASTDANTLDDYEEGDWTPVDSSGAGLSFSPATGKYTKIGRQVTAWGRLTFPSTANGNNNQIGGLPFTIANTQQDRGGGMIGYKTDSTVATLLGENNQTTFKFRSSTGADITNATLSTDDFYFAITYNI